MRNQEGWLLQTATTEHLTLEFQPPPPQV